MHTYMPLSSMPGPVNWRLAGSGLLSDDLFLIAHHEVTGRPYLRPRELGIGLAGGLLAELMFTWNWASIWDGYVRGGDPRMGFALPGDPLARAVLGQIIDEPCPVPVRDWLRFLGQDAAARIAGRLETAGYLRTRVTRLTRSSRMAPADPDWAQCARLRACQAVDASRPLDTAAPEARYRILLAGLACACGLEFRLALPEGPQRGSQEITSSLPPRLAELVAVVQATTDTTVQSGRR
jgi:hypothetical protein